VLHGSLILAFPDSPAPRAVYIDGIWNQEDPTKGLTIIQVPVEKAL
jgi:hypothetical protein